MEIRPPAGWPQKTGPQIPNPERKELQISTLAPGSSGAFIRQGIAQYGRIRHGHHHQHLHHHYPYDHMLHVRNKN